MKSKGCAKKKTEIWPYFSIRRRKWEVKIARWENFTQPETAG
jgi:hypothetical protein